MFCTRCGASIADNSVFCPSCGAPAQRASSAPQQATPPPLTPPTPYAGAGMPTPPIALAYASWGSRVVAYIIDNLIVLVLVIPLALIAGALGMGAAVLN